MHAEAVAGVVDRVINRYKRDPTCMLQILREVQESCDWIPPEAIGRVLFIHLYRAARQISGVVF